MIKQFLFRTMLTLLITMSAYFGYAQQNLKISGYAPQLKDGTVIYLTPNYPRRYAKEQERESKAIHENPSLIVKKGCFGTTTNVRNGDVYTMKINGIKGFKIICIASGKLTINIAGSNLDSVTFAGNKTTLTYELYNQRLVNDKFYKAATQARKAWIEARVARDTALVSLTSKRYDSIAALSAKIVEQINLEHFKQNPESYTNSYILNGSLFLFPKDQVKAIFNSFPKNIVDNKYGDNLRFTIDSLLIGGYAPVFTQNDTAGNPVTLSSYRGKYVLIDFWASWCVPCREDNPNLVKAIQKYGDKNFTIIGVSLDTDKKAWVDAINNDGLNWIHVSDLNRWENQVSVNYDVHAVPSNFLLDPSGKIIAKNLQGKELLEKLGEIIK